ncbi:hypothetical protein BH09BAC3_BH09BAC3_19540 [soil metagenome]
MKTQQKNGNSGSQQSSTAERERRSENRSAQTGNRTRATHQEENLDDNELVNESDSNRDRTHSSSQRNHTPHQASNPNGRNPSASRDENGGLNSDNDKNSSYGKGSRGSSESLTSHKGKGPKGYQRTDERLKEHISDLMSDSHELDASEIEVTVENGEVILSGSIGSKEEKRMAEDLIDELTGVKHVENRLRIGKSSSRSSSSKATKSHLSKEDTENDDEDDSDVNKSNSKTSNSVK